VARPATIGRMDDAPPNDTAEDLDDADLGEYEPV
jgi:hypothetical protein